MTNIDVNLEIGKGRHRKCYTHPTDSDKCIKVNYSDHHRQ